MTGPTAEDTCADVLDAVGGGVIDTDVFGSDPCMLITSGFGPKLVEERKVEEFVSEDVEETSGREY